MPETSADIAHLRQLAVRCRSVALKMSDEIEVASLRQMAEEFDAMAENLERPLMPNPQPPVGA